MKYEVYKDLYIRDMYAIFELFSIGPKGLIPKRIAFIPTEYPDIYNLVFGDINKSDEIDDYSVSDNGDRNKVLATVAYAVEIYLNKHPNRYVFFTGSTKERTRLYRMAIGLNFDELSTKFNIYCQTDTGIIPFQKNISTTGLLIKRKL
ncbi:hypothetical protein SAMN05660909_04898 [Chitinophaga terrae (ex Kim and Jung 2007)]|uniref:Uncharacterized protein n=1 Tax=Chitinophaga terrae (ex Kim and Jung 2007) TaxID=408074 RepID=A0A1H4G3S4_9BACT|nr:hypothetical protein [Chitinophaga terrae (ex Kim and Jung 2007)]GEP92935.1 hypothetical protein CTE07_45800 [Chitinophaga terrae (ex Kim and Jung 2007)]SEB03971.1 hypothetical protein SAMN05660909_04898 [Chitinophaga terrae (ex Kim and Jung 2007)]